MFNVFFQDVLYFIMFGINLKKPIESYHNSIGVDSLLDIVEE